MNARTAVPHVPQDAHQHHGKRDTALWLGVILSVGIHFLAFLYWPEMQADELVVARAELTAVDLPPEVEIPAQPQAIARPATPIAAATQVSEEITIAPTTFEANPVSELPPPPLPSDDGTTSLRDQPTFTPYTVSPTLLNRSEVQKILVREYPQLLKAAGIGGTAIVWFFLDVDGRVLETRIHASTGHPQLDEAALHIAETMRFSPALNRDRKVQVWVQFPVHFRVR